MIQLNKRVLGRLCFSSYWVYTINEAIINCVSVVDTLELLTEEYGYEIEKIIAEILTYAVNDVLWSGEDEEANHKATQDLIVAKYP
ncbi:hypothetical protein A0256_23640 [Mucilaginibacter sp. PAMC 26640]|nr:hypothetical protein A0256_23640 [Mucilaginibacter sp. PAMC 26640]